MSTANRDSRWWLALIGAGLLAAIALGFFVLKPGSTPKGVVHVRYGITPYQDSALPVVAERLGWYKEQGLEIELVPVSWGDVVTALSSGAIDCAIYNFNSFLAPYPSAVQGQRKPVFYAPLYVFKGQAIMVHKDAGFALLTGSSLPDEKEDARRQRVSAIAAQLRGKKIGVTKGTELEQITLEAIRQGGLDPVKDVTLIHASPEDSLAAFLAGSLDAFAAGLTERTEARRRGAVELLVTSDVTLPVVDGIVTTEEFAARHQDVLDRLVGTWFRTISYMEVDLTKNSNHIREYLRTAASTNYSVDEYRIAWTFNLFPQDAEKADRLFNDASSVYYWRRSWDSVNTFLVKEQKISTPVPYSAYTGDQVLKRVAQQAVIHNK